MKPEKDKQFYLDCLNAVLKTVYIKKPLEILANTLTRLDHKLVVFITKHRPYSPDEIPMAGCYYDRNIGRYKGANYIGYHKTMKLAHSSLALDHMKKSIQNIIDNKIDNKLTAVEEFQKTVNSMLMDKINEKY